MKLIKGADLSPRQTEQVLSNFIYRWTSGNNARQRVWHGIAGKPTIALITDNQWLAEHAFWFINSGSRLALNRKYAEPHYLV